MLGRAGAGLRGDLGGFARHFPCDRAFCACTDSVWRPLEFAVEWGGTARNAAQGWDGRLEIFNGIIERVEPVTAGSSVQIEGDFAWSSTVREATDGVGASILYAQPQGHNSFDETIVTVRAACETFSFAANDLVRYGHIFLPDFGVLVRRVGSDVTYDSALVRWRQNREKNIYTRVTTVPEQTLPGAWRDVPAKQPHYIPLGFDGGRQYFGLEPDGSIFCRYGWLARIPGKDTKRCLYDGNRIRYGFGLSDAQLVERSLMEGCLPMMVTPEPMINDFYRAHLSHLLLNTDREVGAKNRRVARVGTFSYGAFSNESCMMVSDLDRRGYHQQAEEALETWLHHQGTVGLPGDFSTKDGQFYGAGGYEDGGYNQHHGFVLWCLGEHYWYTRDAEWLKRVAPKIVKACDWIINERKRTVVAAEKSRIRAIERGLLPAGCLEDIKDWRFWLSTNVYSWWGMQNAAAALADVGLPDGKCILKASAAYREDILRAFTEAMQRSPVVRLRDGSWIPHIPPEVHRRGRTFGWITETLEGAIHMIRTGLIEPDGRMATWIIKDFEDNLYISEQYGYNITGDEFERYWFSRGGISMQANLLCNPIPYLLRDEPRHFLRAYFNAFAVSYWPDTRMMTEPAA